MRMNDKAINEAIAKACGWTCDGKWWSHPTLPDNGGAMPEPPDYCADLNAMADVVGAMDEQHRSGWPMHLRRIVVRDCKDDSCLNPDSGRLDDVWFYNATARQRAEAFLRTLNLWRDDTTERKETK